jgi:hypothetical protein
MDRQCGPDLALATNLSIDTNFNRMGFGKKQAQAHNNTGTQNHHK